MSVAAYDVEYPGAMPRARSRATSATQGDLFSPAPLPISGRCGPWPAAGTTYLGTCAQIEYAPERPVDAGLAADVPSRLARQYLADAFARIIGWHEEPSSVPGGHDGISRALWGKTGKPKNFDHRLKRTRIWELRKIKLVEECGTAREQLAAFKCNGCGDHFKAAPMGCSVRYCPDCAKWIRLRNVRKVKKIVETFTRPRFATLTIRNQQDLRAMMELLVASWQRLRWRQNWKRGCKGCVWVLEVTWSPEKLWHAHLHIVWDGRFIPRGELAADWLEVTKGAGRNIDLRRVSSAKQAANELAKYVGKDLGWGKGFCAVPERLAEFVANLWGFKALRTYGSARKVKEDDPRERVCPSCGSADVEFIGCCCAENMDAWLAERRARG